MSVSPIYVLPNVNDCFLSKKAIELIENYYNFNLVNKTASYDLVYIIKPSECNDDLKYSLRSVAKFCNYRKIWFIGYKPKWVQNIEFVETTQTGTKWQNSMLNWETACKTPNISDDFILMNDDFIAIRPIENLKEDINVCLTNIDLMAKKYINRKASKWQSGFIYLQELLSELNIQSTYNMEAHLPFEVNKQKYLDMLEIPQVKTFDTNKVLHKRSLYYNLYNANNNPKQILDVKLPSTFDLKDYYLKANWISVFDNVIGNISKYPKLNTFLKKLFPTKCIYEK